MEPKVASQTVMFDSSVDWGCKLRRLHLCKGVTYQRMFQIGLKKTPYGVTPLLEL